MAGGFLELQMLAFVSHGALSLQMLTFEAAAAKLRSPREAMTGCELERDYRVHNEECVEWEG